MTKLKLMNAVDESNAATGLIPPEQIRRLEIDALVDTGATSLALPADVVQKLGLRELRRTPVGLADGRSVEVVVVADLRIDILGREMTCDAYVLPAGTKALIGQIQLEYLDLVVDPKNGEAIANPAHPDGPIAELLSVA